MERRDYLRSVALGISVGGGCLGRAGPANLRMNSDTTLPRTVSVTPSDSVSDIDVGMDVSVVESEITQDHTATIEVTLRNESTRKQRFNGGASFPFSPGTSQPEGLVLLEEGSERGTKKDGCWTVENPNEWLTNESTSFLEPGEESSIRLTVWDDPRARGCLSPGEYYFSETFSVGDPTKDPPVFSWGFELSVSE